MIDVLTEASLKEGDAAEINAQSGRGKRWDVHEHIHRTLTELIPCREVRGLLPREVYRDERIEVEVGIVADGSRILLGDRWRSTLRHRCWHKRWADKKSESECNRGSIHVTPLTLFVPQAVSSGSFLLPDALATFTFVQAHMIPGSRIKKAENQAQLL